LFLTRKRKNCNKNKGRRKSLPFNQNILFTHFLVSNWLI